MKRYKPSDIEPKWQKQWDKDQIYTANLKSNKPKYLAMGMFNYPSGKLHLGHAFSFTIPDIMSRYKRQSGYESYHPVGWDSFGLPAENYAVKMGVSPQITTMQCIEDYRASYRAMGWSNDWSKEIMTHVPEYYKWSQWLFSQMYKNGLAYQDSKQQWWCTKCQTVLANEQIDANGKCWRHDSPEDEVVSKKEVRQWFFKVTDYAEEMLKATDALDWTESVKLAQKNWIGKSQGAEIVFHIEGKKENIKVFTTRPDTMFGVTFLVIAPEHEMVNMLSISETKELVEKYVKESTKKTEIERQASKEKTGVFTGSYAINPINQEKIPIWVADYVLVGYGTGAIMAVPGHDERDNEFAKKFNLPILEVVEGDAGGEVFSDEGKLTNSREYDGLNSAAARDKIVADLKKSEQAEEKTIFKIRDWSVTRQRYWGAPTPIIHCPKCGPVLVPEADLPVVLPVITDFAPSGDGRSALGRAGDWLKAKCPECGEMGERETDTLDTYICSSWYMFRYLDPSNTEMAFDPEIAKKWIPVDFYDGADHATAHLIYSRFVTRFFYKLGLCANPEPFKKFLFHGKIVAQDGTMFSKSKGTGVDPLEIINEGYGADALRTYLMFAAPLELWVRWDQKGVPGAYRFLNRVFNLVQEFIESEESSNTNTASLKIVHPAIKKVTEDIESQKFNTAVAAMMKVTNDLYVLKAKVGFKDTGSWKSALESLLCLLAPFAPHIAEELWHDLGYKDTVHVDHWPLWDEKYLTNDTMTIVVQVNGKVRAELEVNSDASEEDIKAEAVKNEKVQKHLEGKEPKKIIYVPGRLVSLVI